MANILESETWDTGVYQLETTDPVQGGVDGVDNIPHKALANRTVWLKAQVALKALLGGSATQLFKVKAAVSDDEAVNKGQIATVLDGLASFGNNLSENGYQKMPNGLILQWGELAVSANTTTYVTLPIAFPNNSLVALASGSGTVTSGGVVNADRYSATQIIVGSQLSGGETLTWFAIGY